MALPLRVPAERDGPGAERRVGRHDVGARKGCCHDITKPALLSVNRIVKTG